jgi:deoxyribose-phosphate aldolase
VSVEDVALLHETVRGELRIKAAGGIRTRDHAMALVKAGAVRLGMSRGPDLIK